MKNLIILLFLLLGITLVNAQDSVKFHHNASGIKITGLEAVITDSITIIQIRHQNSKMKIADLELAKFLGGLSKEDLLYLYNTGQIFDWSSQRYKLLIFGDSVGKFQKPLNQNGLLFSKTEHFTKTPAIDKAKGIFYSKITRDTSYFPNFIFLAFICYFLMIIYGFRHLCRKQVDPERYDMRNESGDNIFSWAIGIVSFIFLLTGIIYQSEIGWNIWFSIVFAIMLVIRFFLKVMSNETPYFKGTWIPNIWKKRWVYSLETLIVSSLLFVASGMATVSFVYTIFTFSAMIYSSYKLSDKSFIGWALD